VIVWALAACALVFATSVRPVPPMR
jgi:hypothetical protein